MLDTTEEADAEELLSKEPFDAELLDRWLLDKEPVKEELNSEDDDRLEATDETAELAGEDATEDMALLRDCTELDTAWEDG